MAICTFTGHYFDLWLPGVGVIDHKVRYRAVYFVVRWIAGLGIFLTSGLDVVHSDRAFFFHHGCCRHNTCRGCEREETADPKTASDEP